LYLLFIVLFLRSLHQ